MAKQKKEFTRNAMEAALCLWESCLHWAYRADESEVAKLPESARRNWAALDERRDYAGSATLREDCADAGQACSDIYFQLPEAVRDIIVFDYEYVPAFFLYGINWDMAKPYPDALARVLPHMQAILDRGNAASRARHAGIDERKLSGLVSLETSGCFKPDGSSIARCPDENATFWTVYGRTRGGLARAIIDCPSRANVDVMATYLAGIARIPLNA